MSIDKKIVAGLAAGTLAFTGCGDSGAKTIDKTSPKTEIVKKQDNQEKQKNFEISKKIEKIDPKAQMIDKLNTPEELEKKYPEIAEFIRKYPETKEFSIKTEEGIGNVKVEKLNGFSAPYESFNVTVKIKDKKGNILENIEYILSKEKYTKGISPDYVKKLSYFFKERFGTKELVETTMKELYHPKIVYHLIYKNSCNVLYQCYDFEGVTTYKQYYNKVEKKEIEKLDIKGKDGSYQPSYKFYADGVDKLLTFYIAAVKDTRGIGSEYATVSTMIEETYPSMTWPKKYLLKGKFQDKLWFLLNLDKKGKNIEYIGPRQLDQNLDIVYFPDKTGIKYPDLWGGRISDERKKANEANKWK